MKNLGVNVLVAYASKHGSTKEIAQYIGEEIEGQVDIKNVNNVNDINYDYIVLGTPIYEQEPLPEMEDFIKKHKSRIKNKRKSVFVVTSDNEEPDKRAKNIRKFTQTIPGEIDTTSVFAGEIELDELNKKEQNSVKNYLNSIDQPVESYSKINKKMCHNFADEINQYINKNLQTN